MKSILKKLINKETVTYLIFGVLTTVVNFAVFKGFDMLFTKTVSVDLVLLTNIIAWVVSVAFAFVTNKLFVFESKSWSPSVAGKEFLGFVGARILSFFAESFLMFVLVTVLSQNEILAKILVGIVVIIMNYVFSKLFIFKKKNTVDAKGE